MRYVLAVAALVAGCTGGAQRPPADQGAADRLRAAAAATVAACPCEIDVEVAYPPDGLQVALRGVADPAHGIALLYEEGRASEVRYAADGRVFAHGAVTHGPWLHARTAQLPFTRTVRPVTLAAVGNPAFAFTLARGAEQPRRTGDTYAVTYDRAVAEPDSLLDRLLGDWPAHGVVATRGGLLTEVRYALLGPVAFAAPADQVTVRVLRTGLPGAGHQGAGRRTPRLCLTSR